MALSLEKTYPRLWSLRAGVVMVVTDLHGDWDAYRRYRDCFVDLHARGQVDGLAFTGDLIHAEPAAGPDRSLEIVLDVMALRASYGAGVMYLCGNHEMPHIYGISLAKGNREYTPTFEAALTESGRRDDVVALFNSLPFYVRTRAGVSLAHAGASPSLADPANAQKIFNWRHRELLDWAEGILVGQDVAALRRSYAKLSQAPSYQSMAQHYLCVSGPGDPRYDHLLRGFLASSAPSFDLLWSALFTRCELEYGPADYAIFLDAMLKELSRDFHPQHVLVSGHIVASQGHAVVAQRHVRLASGIHARPRESGKYLIFDAARPVRSATDLLGGLKSVY
jgi:hypothetical protein